MTTHQEAQVLCGLCGKTCKNKTALTSHMNSHELFSCNECGKQFHRRHRLNVHIKMVHLGVFEHQCNICSKVFTDGREKKKHILTVHEQLKPWFCDLCTFRTARYTNLGIHKKKMHSVSKQIPLKDFLQLIKDGNHPNQTDIDLEIARILE